MKQGLIGILKPSLLLSLLAFNHAASTLAESILLKNGTVHTITMGDMEQGDVLIENNRISLVARSIDTPTDQVIDLEGKHLYPGMIAMTTTLGLLEINAVRSTLDTTEVGQWTPEILSWRAINPDSELIQ